MKRQRIVVSVACAGTLLVGAYLGACGGDDNVAVVGNDGGGDATTDGSSFDSSVRDTGAADTGAADTGETQPS